MSNLCYNICMSELTKIFLDKAVEKYRFIFENGYSACRKDEIYTPETVLKANCICHSLANPTNSLIEKFDLIEQKLIFNEYFAKHGLIKTAELLGLKAKVCNKSATADQFSWKIGYYYSTSNYHFIKQESPNLFSHKMGWEKNLEYMLALPEKIIGRKNVYKLYNTFLITNPNGKNLSKEEIKEIEKDLAKL